MKSLDVCKTLTIEHFRLILVDKGITFTDGIYHQLKQIDIVVIQKIMDGI
jgi:hypothetical protein